jgi:hypothetical protein
MDEEHLAAALRYVSLNPVRARLVARAQDWRWSSTSGHLRGKADSVTAVRPVRDRFPRREGLDGNRGRDRNRPVGASRSEIVLLSISRGCLPDGLFAGCLNAKPHASHDD